MMENYLASARDAQMAYQETIGRCLHTLMGDFFNAHPAVQKVGVNLDYTPYPPYSCTYIIRDTMIDLGCGWMEVPTVYTEDVGKIVWYIYTHAQAIIPTKGMGMLEWNRKTYNATQD